MSHASISTDRQVAGLRPAERLYEAPVAGVKGLSVRVFPSGTKAFEVRYVALNGVRRRFPLGAYPGVSLKDAREEAARVRANVQRGADPSAERDAARHAARTGDTLSDLADAYFTAAAKGLHGGRGRPKSAGTLKIERSRFDKRIKPALGAIRFTELKRSDVKAFMRALATAGELAADTISSIGGTLHNILAFAVHEERLDVNPATGSTRPLALHTRDRMFDDAALGRIWTALQGASKGSPSPVMALALRFALLTLCRRSEACGARWQEIDLDLALWTVPGSRTKNRKAHTVPLSPMAIETLSELRRLTGAEDGFLFPSPAGAGDAAEDERPSITPDGFTRALARTLRELGMPAGSPHDFRRSGATTLTGERWGFRQFIVGKVLGHTTFEGAAVTGLHYDRNEYLREKRAALEAWAIHLSEVATGSAAPSNLVRLRSADA
jgi:integrase